jgi:hypothetical protein
MKHDSRDKIQFFISLLPQYYTHSKILAVINYVFQKFLEPIIIIYGDLHYKYEVCITHTRKQIMRHEA